MAKLTDNILRFIAAAGVKLTDQETTALSALSQEEVSAEIQTVFDRVANDTTSEFSRLAARSANLDRFDQGLEDWADILGDDIKPIAKEKGVQKLDKIKAQISAKIKEAKEAAKNGDNADVAKLREQITSLELRAQTLEAEKETAVAAAKAESDAELFNYQMLSKIQGRKDIVPHFNNESALSKLVLPDVMEYITGKGLKFSGKKLDVVKADNNTPYLKNAKAVTADELIEEALTEKKYRQIAGETPPRSGVEVVEDNSGQSTKVSRVAALRPEPRVI